MNKAIFLDRDGVINEDTRYVHKIEDFVFCEGIFEFCRQSQEHGYLLIVITNQAGIARGYYTEKDVQILHNWMREQFQKHGIKISDVFYCPYHTRGSVPEYTKESKSRKPEPGMILEAARKWNISLQDSYMIGDKLSDRIRLPLFKSLIIKSKYTEAGYDFASLEDVRRFLFPAANTPQ